MGVPMYLTVFLLLPLESSLKRNIPCDSASKESACNVGDLGSTPWVRKIPWKRERLPTPLFWPGKFHGLYSSGGNKELDTTEQLSLSREILKSLF